MINGAPTHYGYRQDANIIFRNNIIVPDVNSVPQNYPALVDDSYTIYLVLQPVTAKHVLMYPHATTGATS